MKMGFLGRVLPLMLLMIAMGLAAMEAEYGGGEGVNGIKTIGNTHRIRCSSDRRGDIPLRAASYLDLGPEVRVYKASIDFTLPENKDRAAVEKELSRHDLILEVALVLTPGMVEKFSSKKELKHFVFTTMKQVDDIFRLPSFGVNIAIQLKSYEILSTEEAGSMNVTRDTQNYNYLRNFQRTVLRKGITADAIVLISDTTEGGRAYFLKYLGVAGRNTAVVGFNGFETGYVIAHEIGHLIGLNHPSRFCRERSDKVLHIMRDTTNFQRTGGLEWSGCSRMEIPFLLRNLKSYLLDTSTTSVDISKYAAPGVFWSIARQCELRFGAGYSPDLNPERSECEKIFCKGPTRERRGSFPLQLMLPLEGSRCGRNNKQRCVDQKCINMNTGKETVNGGWGEWKVTQKCNCKVKVETDRRKCNNPKPKYGGLGCVGDRVKRERLCSPCDKKSRNTG